MTQKHTPGPWHRNIKPATKYNTIFAGRNTHVTRLAVEGKSEDEVEANCALITAAPDLLRVVSEMLGAAETDGMDEKSNVWRSLMIDARAAIAKATGTTTPTLKD